jgi:CRP-like cAMP-binding protein
MHRVGSASGLPSARSSNVSRHNKQDALAGAARHNRVLSALPKRAFNAILSNASLQDLELGRTLYRQDKSFPAVYFPITGIVSIFVGTSETRDVELATVGNEGVVGATAALGVLRAVGRAVVQVPGQAILVSTKPFQEVLRKEEQLSQFIQRYIYLFLRQVMQSGACNRLHTATERCARWLLMAHDRAGANQFRITQAFIAAMMGTRRAEVNRALAEFRRAGAVDYKYRSIVILDRRQLESFSCRCYELLQAIEQQVNE